MSDKILVPVTQQNPSILSEPLVVSNVAKRFFTLQRQPVFVKPAPNLVITSQPQQIIHQPSLFLNKETTKKTKKTRDYFKIINVFCKNVTI